MIGTGGGKVDDEDALRLGLSRSTLDVVKIGDQHYGLLKHYPHIKRGGTKKRRVPFDQIPDTDGAEEVPGDAPNG